MQRRTLCSRGWMALGQGRLQTHCWMPGGLDQRKCAWRWAVLRLRMALL